MKGVWTMTNRKPPAPPPTRFGPKTALLKADPRHAPGRLGVLPPPTKFAAGPSIQRKSGPISGQAKAPAWKAAAMVLQAASAESEVAPVTIEVPIGEMRFAKPGQKLVTNGLGNCICVILCNGDGSAVMNHINTNSINTQKEFEDQHGMMIGLFKENADSVKIVGTRIVLGSIWTQLGRTEYSWGEKFENKSIVKIYGACLRHVEKVFQCSLEGAKFGTTATYP